MTLSGETCRLDVWLWRARFFKTRGLASRHVEGGRIRRTRPGEGVVRIDKASRTVRPGDQLTFALGERIVVLTVLACGTRRGPPSEAQALYVLSEDYGPQPAPWPRHG